jgi:glucoamylase
MSTNKSTAPGWPGIEARWTSSAKDGMGTALSSQSRIWYALSHGIVNEVYFPRIDQACTRDFQFIVTDGETFFSEEKRDTDTTMEMCAPGVPMFRIVNRCRNGRYTLVKEVFADPEHDCLVQRIHFEKWSPELRLFVLLAPHIRNHGMGNTAWAGDHKGTPMLFAERENVAMALACSSGWSGRSVGFVGVSDGWQDLERSKKLTWFYDRAEDGNVAMTGEVKLTGGSISIVLGFGRNCSEAGHKVRGTLGGCHDELLGNFIRPWQDWQASLRAVSSAKLYRTSTAVLRTHEDKVFRGGTIASLSIPWGSSKGDNDLGGYHLVWPRDLVETASGFLAAGANDEAARILNFLRATQEADGHWPQNMWLDGTPYWTGIQMDEVALPVLAVDLAFRQKAISPEAYLHFWPMVRAAANFIIENGPVSAQDRWEEDAGYSPYTIATEIAALVVSADLARAAGDLEMAASVEATADAWFAKIDEWTYARDTDLSQELGIDGYYIRIAPNNTASQKGSIAIRNRPLVDSVGMAEKVVSPDALALVRFGLRAADDPRILNTVTVIDSLLKCDFPSGPSWYRYNGDGYGEHEDGSPFDGTGLGRPWPLLTGERAHYELANGRRETARMLAKTMSSFANGTGLIPEQVWDVADIPERELYCGCPTGSAMPLVWAHSEYIKLIRSLKDARVFDLPPQTVDRYLS